MLLAAEPYVVRATSWFTVTSYLLISTWCDLLSQAIQLWNFQFGSRIHRFDSFANWICKMATFLPGKLVEVSIFHLNSFIELEDFLFRWSNLRNDWLRVRICKIDSQKEWKVAPLIYRIICICPINTSLWVSADQSQLCFVKRNIRPHCHHLSFFEGMLHQWQADRSNYRTLGRIQFKSKVFW